MTGDCSAGFTRAQLPLTNAAAAVSRLVVQVAHALCAEGRWIGARAL